MSISTNSLIKNPKAQTNRTSFEEICEESSISQPQESLFLAIFSNLLEIYLRFENESSLYISEVIQQQIVIQLENIRKVNVGLDGVITYFMSFWKVITDSSTYDRNTRKSYLSAYLTQENVTLNLCFIMRKILILHTTDQAAINRLESKDIDSNLAEICLEKVADIFSLALIILFEDGTAKKVIKLEKKCPLAYFYVTNKGEVLIMYTKSMIDENNFEVNKLVRSLTDIENNIKLLESHYEERVIVRHDSENLKSLQAFKNVVEKSSFSQKFEVKPKLMPQENSSLNSNNKIIKNVSKPPPPLINPNKNQKEEVKIIEKTQKNLSVSVSYEPSQIEIKSSPSLLNPSYRPELPPVIIQYFNYVGEMVSREKIHDKKLQELTKNIINQFPELDKNIEHLISSIPEPLKAEKLLPIGVLFAQSSNPAPASKLFPNPPPSNLNPLLNSSKIMVPNSISPSNSQNFSIPKAKICLFSQNPEPENLFSDIYCLDCSNSICNKCRILNNKYCIKCKRLYEKSEIDLLVQISQSMNPQKENPVYIEEYKEKYKEEYKEEYKNNKNLEVNLRNSSRNFKPFRKCKEHLGMVDEELFINELKCSETCVICNECRVTNLEECLKCKRVYNDDEKKLIQGIRDSMKGT